MSVLQVTEIDVHDMNRFAEYGRGVAPMLAQYGARPLGVSLQGVDAIEGDWRPPFLVVTRWPSRQAWDSFYADPAYQPLKALRHEATSCNLVLFEAQDIPA